MLHSICQQIWKTQRWPQEWKRSILVPVSKKRRMCNWTIELISHASNVMLKILQAKLQLYANQELAVVQAGFRKGRENKDQIANICWIIEKAREFQKSIYLCFINYTKAFDCVDHKKLWEALREMGIPDHLTCLLRNLYVGQEAAVPCMEQLIVSRLRKEYNRSVCCHPVCLTYTLSTLWKLLGWMSYKLESR